MNGLGYFIWQLDTINDFYSPESLAKLLKQANVKWVSWKLCEGIYRYNQSDQLVEYMKALADVGIVSGGWSYNYPEKAASQAALIEDRIAEFGNLDHWMLDIEGEWKQPGLTKNIDALLNFKANIPVGFCSYRYPALHQPLNFSRFLGNDRISFNAPQVYWLGAHDPLAQLDLSFSQYSKITSKPFVPIGSSWGQKVGKNGIYWEPTRDDLKVFVFHCYNNGWTTFGFWSLDWIVKKQRIDFLEAIGGVTIKPPVVPPGVSTHVVVTYDGANPRTRPVISPVSDGGALKKGMIFEKLGKSGPWYEVKVYLHENVADEV